IYRTDARLARWEKAHELKIAYRGGRPDAVGAYPSIRTVLPIRQAGGPMGLLFATRLGGLIRGDGGKTTSHALPGQLGAEFIEGIEDSREGLLVFGGSRDGGDWRYRGAGWEPASFAPPYEPADPKGFEAQMRPRRVRWFESLTR